MTFSIPRYLILFGCMVPALFRSSPASATIYKYVDDNGVVHYTNVPSDPRFKAVYRPRPKSSTWRFERLYQSLIDEAARLYEVDANLIKAIIKAESNFDKNAVSPKGAVGLMQLMPETARDLRVNDSYDPKENIYGGTRYFKKLYDKFDQDLNLALASYNAGPTRVAETWSVPDITETRNYVKLVLKYYRTYSRQS